jgi:hypothetical protein
MLPVHWNFAAVYVLQRSVAQADVRQLNSTAERSVVSDRPSGCGPALLGSVTELIDDHGGHITLFGTANPAELFSTLPTSYKDSRGSVSDTVVFSFRCCTFYCFRYMMLFRRLRFVVPRL